jgi:hypothetical protein
MQDSSYSTEMHIPLYERYIDRAACDFPFDKNTTGNRDSNCIKGLRLGNRSNHMLPFHSIKCNVPHNLLSYSAVNKNPSRQVAPPSAFVRNRNRN